MKVIDRWSYRSRFDGSRMVDLCVYGGGELILCILEMTKVGRMFGLGKPSLDCSPHASLAIQGQLAQSTDEHWNHLHTYRPHSSVGTQFLSKTVMRLTCRT